jgi:hypothetical protein
VQELRSGCDHYFKLVVNALRERRLFITTRAYLGVGDQRVAIEHRICIFYCAPVPFSLREIAPDASQLLSKGRPIVENSIH